MYRRQRLIFPERQQPSYRLLPLFEDEHSIKAYFMKFANADFENPETRRMLFEYFVDKIYLYEDRLVFISWYSEENREVPYEALNGDDEGRPSSSIASPLAPRSPNRPLSRMGCGGDYRFQSRGRTAVGFYHPAGRPTASPAGYFYAQLRVYIVGPF